MAHQRILLDGYISPKINANPIFVFLILYENHEIYHHEFHPVLKITNPQFYTNTSLSDQSKKIIPQIKPIGLYHKHSPMAISSIITYIIKI